MDDWQRLYKKASPAEQECMSRNIRKYMAHGKPRDQAIAIAASECGISRKRERGVLYADLRNVGWLDRLRYRHITPGLRIGKAADGLRYMELVTSNAYKDRDNETITSKALWEYVEKGWIADDLFHTKNVLKFWHRYTIGDIIWADMEGPFLIEYAKERRGTFRYKGKRYPVSKIWDYIETHPQYKWGASHGFLYKAIRVNVGTGEVIYDHIRKFESTVLPLRYAANPFTHSEVIGNAKP